MIKSPWKSLPFAVRCPAQGRLPWDRLIFIAVLCLFPLPSCSFPSFAIFKTFADALQKQLCDKAKISTHMKCKTLVLVGSNKSHPHQSRGDTRRGLGCCSHSPMYRSHFCCFMCISTEVTEAHGMIFQIFEICVACRALK